MPISASNAPQDADRPGRLDNNTGPMSRGILLKPLGWMGPHLLALAQHHSGLTTRLLGLDWAQIHLLAFALAHDPVGLGSGAIVAAAGAPVRAVLAELGMARIAGLDRLLRHLPPKPLHPEDYRSLPRLLADSVTANVLNLASVVDEAFLSNLGDLSSSLRTLPIVTALGDESDGASALLDWIGLLAQKRGDPDDRHVTGQLTAARTFRDLRAHIARLCAELPLPDGLPPAVIGDARRLETAADIRLIAHQFSNCLRDRIDDVDAGVCLFYLWQRDDDDVVCELSRAKRLGWALCECLGPRNAMPDKNVIRQIKADFRRAGVWPLSVAVFADTMIANLENAEPHVPRAGLPDDADEDESGGLSRRCAPQMPPF
jgi:hypothetical protein